MKACPKCNARFRGDLAFCPLDGTPLDTAADPFIGMTVAGRYLVEEKLGSGGMGSVYRARHRIIGRDVALKFLDARLCKDERQRRRFIGEARAANQINHEHIIDISDYGETEDGVVYMVMEYLRGRSLAVDIHGKHLNVRRALRITRQVSLGLARAHELGVVHRDVKPENIYLVRRNHDSDFVKLLDFGVARNAQDMRITAQGTIVGTPEYIAPEQIRSGAASASSDLYALGCVLFEMLTGQLPFSGQVTLLLVKHLNDPPPVPSSIANAVPKAVDQLVLRLLSKAPEDRHRDGYHLAEDIQHLIDRMPVGKRHASEPEITPSEPASSPATEAAEGDYQRTLANFVALTKRAHPNGDIPPRLRAALELMHTCLTEAAHLRTQLEEAARKASDQLEDAREPRVQIGRALDELANDDSRVMGELSDLQSAIAERRHRMHVLIGQCTAIAPALQQDRDAREHPSLDQLRAHGATLQELANCKQALEAQLGERDAIGAYHRDLTFQVAQLKNQLGTLHDTCTLDQEVLHDEVNRLDGQLQRRLSKLAETAAQVSHHFQNNPGNLENRHTPDT